MKHCFACLSLFGWAVSSFAATRTSAHYTQENEILDAGGRSSASTSYSSSATIGTPVRTATSADYFGTAGFIATQDGMTEAPTLIAPASSTAITNPLTVTFTLPEAALAGSVALDFYDGTTTRTLHLTDESAATHSLSFIPANPAATSSGAVLSGSAIPDGTYTVTLSYQDAAANPLAAATVTGVIVDTTGPVGGVLTLHPSVIHPGQPASVEFENWVDAAGTLPLRYEVLVDGLHVAGTTAATTQNFTAPLTVGEHALKTRIYDALDNYTETSQSFAITPPAPVATLLSSKAGAVPAAGQGPGGGYGPGEVAPGATWVGFGIPAINDAGQVAFLGRWRAPKSTSGPAQSGAGIFVDDVLVAKVGDPVAGAGVGDLPSDAVWKNFKDPVLDPVNGFVAVIGTIKGTGITSANDTVLATTVPSVQGQMEPGPLAVLAHEGLAAPGTGGAFYKSLTSVSIASTGVGSVTVYWAGMLLAGSGTPATISTTDAAAWAWSPASGPAELVVREGMPVPDSTVPGDTVKNFVLLHTLGGLSANVGPASWNRLQFHLATTQRQTGLSPWQPGIVGSLGGAALYRRTGDDVGPAVPGAVWKDVGPPVTSVRGGFATLGTMAPNYGGVVAANTKAIFAAEDNEAELELVARQGDPAPEGIDAVLKTLKAPVFGKSTGTNYAVAFAAMLKGTGITTANDTALFWRRHGAPLALLAREGAQAAECPPGALWKTFTVLALPDGAADSLSVPQGPLFTAFLKADAGGVDTTNDFGLWGLDSTGALHLLVREGQELAGKTVKNFSVLKTTAGSPGVPRAYNATPTVILRANFTDATQALLSIDLP